MKIQCSVCEMVEATILCCADGVALCRSCDENIHAINNIAASKHHRVSLSDSSTPMPKCDICQENIGYFFCQEDRALLCRRCDFCIHTLNNSMSSHQRFLLTGVKVGLVEVGPPNQSVIRTNSNERTPEGSGGNQPNQMPGAGGSSSIPRTLPTGGGFQPAPWETDAYLGLHDFDPNFELMDNGSPKVDGGKGSDSDYSPKLESSSSEEKLDVETCIGQVRDVIWMAVPQMHSSSTSGVYCPKKHHELADVATFVPDGGYFPPSRKTHYQSGLKRLRQLY